MIVELSLATVRGNFFLNYEYVNVFPDSVYSCMQYEDILPVKAIKVIKYSLEFLLDNFMLFLSCFDDKPALLDNKQNKNVAWILVTCLIVSLLIFVTVHAPIWLLQIHLSDWTNINKPFHEYVYLLDNCNSLHRILDIYIWQCSLDLPLRRHSFLTVERDGL